MGKDNSEQGLPAPRGGPGRGLSKPVVKPRDLKGTLIRLWKLTKGSRQGLGWILLLSAFASASAIFSPYVIGNAVSRVDSGNPLGSILFLLAGLYLCDWLVRFLQQFFMASLGQRMIHFIRSRLFDAMKELPLSFFDKRQHGELMSRLTNDVDNISTTISNSLTQLLTYGFTIIGIFCMMVSLSPLLTLVSLVGVGLIFLLTRIVTKHTRKLFKERQRVLGKLNGQVEETISGETIVKAFGQEQQVIEQFEEYNEELRRVSVKALVWSGYLMPLMNVINNLSYVGISIVSGILAVNRAISIGMISSFLLYVKQFSRPFVDIANIYNNFQTAVAGAERILDIMDETPEPRDVEGALSLDSPVGEIELQNVYFGYSVKEKELSENARMKAPGDVPGYSEKDLVLKGISLKIPAGTRTAIVGSTGAGKTTIINLLTRFYDVTDGAILLDGHDLREYKMEDLRRAFGVVLQDCTLFAASIRDNICYGQEEADRKTENAAIKAENAAIRTENAATKADRLIWKRYDDNEDPVCRAARMAGADAFIRRLPQGYDTILTQGGMELSQGERQLLTIARAMLTDAPILILDEATSSVDTVTEQKIRDAVFALTAGRTSFIIAHRLSTIKNSDLIVLLEDGKIAEQGNHEELMKLNGKYAAMYRLQTCTGKYIVDQKKTGYN